jgi:RHS repeat-associated protein
VSYFLEHQQKNAQKTLLQDYDGVAVVTIFYAGSLLYSVGCERFGLGVVGLEEHYDPDVELFLVSYYGYRYYDATTGRWPSRDPIGGPGSVSWFERYAKVQTIKSSLGGALYISSMAEYRRSITSFLFRPSESYSELNLYNTVGNSLINGYDYLGQLSCFDLNTGFQNPTPECGNIDGFYRHCVNTCLLNKCTLGLLGDGFADWVAGDDKKNDTNSNNDRWANDLGDAIGDAGGDCESGCASELVTEHALECCQDPNGANPRRNKDDANCPCK